MDDPRSNLRRGGMDSYHDVVFESEIIRQTELTRAAYEQYVFILALFCRHLTLHPQNELQGSSQGRVL